MAASSVPGAGGAAPVALRDVAAAHFEPYVGETFVFETPPGAGCPAGVRTSMELLSVTLGRKLATRRHPFSTLFRRREGPELGPVLHLLVHPAFQPEPIYVARITPPLELDPRESYYEAIFT